jgi:hypothetical protein
MISTCNIAVRAKLTKLIVTFTAASLFVLCFSSTLISAEGYPQATISNGQITAKVFLPDPVKGYYRSTRFDWSGALNSLEYKGHNYYGVWYDRVDPKVINWTWDGTSIVSGPCSALYGPVDEFQTPLGFSESKPGGTFIKIGVGILRRTEGNYDRYRPYDVLDSGKWTVKKHKDSIEFRQEISDPVSGYAYVYRKTIRLEKGRPNMVIEHSLKNTGKKPIESSVYNHNFVVLDKQPPGPDFTFRVPFQIKPMRPPDKNVVEVRGNEIVYLRPLAGKDEHAVLMQGFGTGASDNEIVIENKKVGAGLKISTDQPLLRELLWSIRTVLAVEPYIAINIQPGAEFVWNDKFEYYTLTAGK